MTRVHSDAEGVSAPTEGQAGGNARRPKTGLSLGCLVDPLAAQLSAYAFDADVMSHFQRDMEAVSRAHVRHLIPYSQAMKAYDKLAKKIVAHIDAKNPLAKATGETGQ